MTREQTYLLLSSASAKGASYLLGRDNDAARVLLALQGVLVAEGEEGDLVDRVRRQWEQDQKLRR